MDVIIISKVLLPLGNLGYIGSSIWLVGLFVFLLQKNLQVFGFPIYFEGDDTFHPRNASCALIHLHKLGELSTFSLSFSL